MGSSVYLSCSVLLCLISRLTLNVKYEYQFLHEVCINDKHEVIAVFYQNGRGDEDGRREQMEKLVRDELDRWDSDASMRDKSSRQPRKSKSGSSQSVKVSHYLYSAFSLEHFKIATKLFTLNG